MTERPDQPQAHAVHISAMPGDARIAIDGTPLAPGTVTGYVLQHDVHEALPLLVLHTRQPEGAQWEGLARVAVGMPQSPAEVITGFLSRVDAAALERAALYRDDLGNEKHDLTRAMLRQLSEWAAGGDT